MVSAEPFSILDRLADSDRPHLASPEEMCVFFNELNLFGAYQILAWKREVDHGGRIEIFVDYEDKVLPNVKNCG